MSKECSDFPGLKISHLRDLENGDQGHSYYCKLCEEVLVLSRRAINPRKLSLIFNETCPGCGFSLEAVLECEILRIPIGIDAFVNPRCNGGNYLVDQPSSPEFSVINGKVLLADQMPTLTTGIVELDRQLVLRFSQLVALNGKESHALSALLCVRVGLPKPDGNGSDVVFIDGGNVFDAYLLSEFSLKHKIATENALARIHLSRAFNHHQLSRLLNEKLPLAIDEFKAKLAVVSDITQLYCDPNVRNKREILEIFRKDVRSLVTLAEQKSVLIIATNLQTRNRSMDNVLMHTAHISATLKDTSTFTQLTLTRHPSNPQLKTTISPDKQTLESYM